MDEITQEDIDKLLEGEDGYSQYMIIGQNVKSIEELARDIVGKLEVTEEYSCPFYSSGWHPVLNEFSVFLKLFGTKYNITTKYIIHKNDNFLSYIMIHTYGKNHRKIVDRSTYEIYTNENISKNTFESAIHQFIISKTPVKTQTS